MKKLNCPLCGEKSYSHKIKKVQLTYKGNTILYKQPGYWCDSCNEGVIESGDRKATQKQLMEFRSSIDGLLTPDEIKRIRKKLKLTQRGASQQFGGGVNAFNRYEKGETQIYRATSQILRLLDKDPSQLKELQNYGSTAIPMAA